MDENKSRWEVVLKLACDALGIPVPALDTDMGPVPPNQEAAGPVVPEKPERPPMTNDASVILDAMRVSGSSFDVLIDVKKDDGETTSFGTTVDADTFGRMWGEIYLAKTMGARRMADPRPVVEDEAVRHERNRVSSEVQTDDDAELVAVPL